ncbi:hypothetical protein A4G18_07355 [Pasteurellaceae bacterium Pebbles2]|nr:hypothetical protein [Pasteurellaceae bacterium Pebbles2]
MYRLNKKNFASELASVKNLDWNEPSLWLEPMKARTEALDLIGDLLILAEQKGIEIAKAAYRVEYLRCHCMLSRAQIKTFQAQLDEQQECWQESIAKYNQILASLSDRPLDTSGQDTSVALADNTTVSNIAQCHHIISNDDKQSCGTQNPEIQCQSCKHALLSADIVQD